MRILIWHGYLLAGTGSNIYTQAVAREWARAGHDVVVFCREPHPERFDLAGAEVVRLDTGRLLPVFVLDRYEGLEPRLLHELPEQELQRFVAANAAALRGRLPADLVFANHVLLGAPVARASGARFAVKAHGSELEYSIRASPRLRVWAREELRDAAAVYVGSAHVRRVLEDVVGHVERVHEVPPGVDIDEFRPRPRADALRALLAEARRDPPNAGSANERLPDEGNAERLERFFADSGPIVLYVGKLLLNKGVHVLFEAMREVEARVLVVGFGDYRRELEALAPPNATFTGPLEHRHLAHLFPLVDVTVVPSIFPEAFGMVAAEAAAGGSPPLVARHSGLAEIAEGLEAEYPPELRPLASFTSGNSAELTSKLRELLALPGHARTALAAAARRAAERRWSWAGVARRLLEPLG